MSRAIKTDRPRRSTCRICKAPTRQLSTGNGRPIVIERDSDAIHRCRQARSGER